MKATITKTYKHSPDGVSVVIYAVGEEVSGAIADAAIAAGKAKAKAQPKKPSETKPDAPKDTK